MKCLVGERKVTDSCAVGCLRCQLVCPENARVDLLVGSQEVFDEEETAALLAGAERSALSPVTRAKLERCGLDYFVAPLARNLSVLIG